jgi:hypothetical protein
MTIELSRHWQRGQIVVEYVLMLSIAVVIAAILISKLVKIDSEDPSNSGALIQKWQSLQKGVANDKPN